MEDDGRKVETPQSPNHSDNGSNVHNKKNRIQAIDDRWQHEIPRTYKIHELEKAFQEIFHRCKYLILTVNECLLREMSVENHIMERYGIIDSVSQSPIHSDKRSNVHNEGGENQEILHRCFPGMPGIKVSSSQSPIHSDKRSNVQNEFQAPKMQTIHFWDDLYFSSPVISLTQCMIPSIGKDENTVQNRDQAVRSKKVTDTPEVLDTHLTKEDVDSKGPQNNWREGIFSLRWKHLQVRQIIVLFLFTIAFAQGISSQCETNQTMNCTQLFLICSFDTDVIQLAKNLFMNHVQNNSMDLEIILVCQRSSNGFHCETSPTYEFVSVESNRLTVKIPKMNLEHAGKYWCDVQGFVDIDRKVCELSSPDTSSVFSDSFEQENRPSCKEERSRPATNAIYVLCALLVVALLYLILISIYFIWKIHYATRFNFKHCKSERFALTTNTKETRELLKSIIQNMRQQKMIYLHDEQL